MGLTNGLLMPQHDPMTGAGTKVTRTWRLYLNDIENALISTPVSPAEGGTGLDNGSSTISIGGNLAFSGAFSTTFTVTGVTNVTLPTTGTIISTTTGAALTRVNDTNVTVTLGGTPGGALVLAASLTLGWTGQLAVTRGGTGLATLAQGDLIYGSAANTFSALAKNTTATRYLSNTGASNNPAWGQVDLTNGVTGLLPAGNGGTGSGAFTIGSVVFAGAAGVYTQDNANFFWDDTNNRLGIGTTSPGQALDVLGTNANVTIRSRNTGTSFRSAISVESPGAYFEIDAYGSAFAGSSLGNPLANMSRLLLNPVGSGVGAIGTQDGHVLVLATNDTEAIRVDTSQRVGIGITSVTAVLHLKGGTATASTAPLKFTSGTNLTSAEAGAMEFATDDFFLTITTGAARKGIVLDDGTRLTSGKYPKASTNGRLIDGPTPLAGTKVYYVSDTSGGAVTRKLTFTDGILTAET